MSHWRNACAIKVKARERYDCYACELLYKFGANTELSLEERRIYNRLRYTKRGVMEEGETVISIRGDYLGEPKFFKVHPKLIAALKRLNLVDLAEVPLRC